MNKWIKWLLILIVVGIIGAIGAWWYTFHKPALNAFDEKPALDVKATKIIEDFTTDEKLAYTTYTNKENNKVISINGTIANIDKNDSVAVIALEDMIMGVTFEFKGEYLSKQLEKLNKLQVGQTIKIKGKCNGYLMDVKMDNCVIEE